ncbi:MAG: tRNA uridine-5-carboxymethylaminomethyl(34) synthesis GTPase MnmE [Candidatus Cryosericum sp.]
MPQLSTIAAIATARGRSGIGIVRLSGPDAWTIAEHLTAGQPPLVPRMANLRKIRRPGETEPLDEGIILAMRGPQSYTGEDTVELQLHGSPLLLDRVLETCIALGARLALPGEYTFRALMAGKLSLLRAEAVRDLVDAGSDDELALARRSFFGDTAKPFRSVLEQVTTALASLEGPLDFPEQFTQEDDLHTLQQAQQSVARARTMVRELLADAHATARLQRGVTVVIAGSPNVGKSSLMNALLKYPRVIVSDVPGTTRDSVSDEILLEGHRVTLVDTAGIGASPVDRLDALARDRAQQAVAAADVVLIVLDAVAGLQPHERLLLESAKQLPHLVAVNKIDVEPVPADLAVEVGEPVLGISATEGTELSELTTRLTALVNGAAGTVTARQLVTHRQAAELETADRALSDFERLSSTSPSDVLAEVLGEAREAMLRLLGEHISSDEVLATVFSTFCIGK